MKNIFLYPHGGSGNHGCEAIVRATCKINNFERQQCKLFSSRINEDIANELDKICDLKPYLGEIKKYTKDHFILAFRKKLLRNEDAYEIIPYYNMIKEIGKKSVALSIGGDNYCYKGMRDAIILINRQLRKRNVKTILWGCSIEPNDMTDIVIDDLKKYDLIISRESITYNALLSNGIIDNVFLYPDPAFQLDSVQLSLPKGFKEGNTVGLNISPLISEYESNKGITYKAYATLIDHIFTNTDMSIALIPHVVWEGNNDLEPLTKLYKEFKDTNRIILLSNHNCMELKGFISRCRMFVAARTHASIAAYSSCVPTLVVGYSVKALGIARDIFGSEENYVIPVKKLQGKNDLIYAFEYIKKNEKSIRSHLQDIMPEYCAKALEAGKEVRKLLNQ